MPQIIPAGWREMSVTGTARREIETLSYLAATLPASYLVYHGVHWTKVSKGFSVYGEIDFIVVAPNGRMLVVEQRSGLLAETEDGLVKQYSGKPRNIETQIMRNLTALSKSFNQGGDLLDIDYILYCPDYQVRNLALAGIDAARIVDAPKRARLAAVIQQALPAGPETPQLAKVKRFLGTTLHLAADPSAMLGQAEELVTRLSGGLATWARQLEFSPFRLRVTGTAGSGKTQLALAEYAGALAAGLKPLYVCYNRPLADHFARLAGPGGRVGTYHMLCDAMAREQGGKPDYTVPGAFAEVEAAMQHAAIGPGWLHDVLIVDEGQDFSAAWRDALLRLLKPDGRAIWLEDPMQNLYGRDPVPLPGWVTMRSQANYRSPRKIVEMICRLGDCDAIEAAGPFLDADIDILTWPEGDTARLLEATRQAITLCLAAGFRREDMALISFHGRDQSALLKLDALGQHTLHSFTGEYDWFGNPVFRDGQLLAESVYRFKGQSAPAVIFTEIDFAEMDARTVRKLFVGMTRARLKLVLVLGEQAARLLKPAIG